MAATGAAFASGAVVAMGGLPSRVEAAAPLRMHSRLTSYAFGKTATKGLVSLVDNGPPPVVRLRQNVPAVIDLTNGLDDYTTMHWHGLRIPNKMDGVPYLTQFPIAKGETFRYAFTPPDAGTYWYHPHCMTMNQMALGLTGVLIIEEPQDIGFDQDLVPQPEGLPARRGRRAACPTSPRAARRETAPTATR